VAAQQKAEESPLQHSPEHILIFEKQLGLSASQTSSISLLEGALAVCGAAESTQEKDF